jgi:hypothetical protein
MDILQSMLNSQGTTVPPPSGPRTQGGIDVIVQEDLRIVDSLPIMRLADLDANAMNVRPDGTCRGAIRSTRPGTHDKSSTTS